MALRETQSEQFSHWLDMVSACHVILENQFNKVSPRVRTATEMGSKSIQ